jgi:hypothetical protein
MVLSRCYELRRRSTSSTRLLASWAVLQARCSGPGTLESRLLELTSLLPEKLKLRPFSAGILSLRVKILFRDVVRRQSAFPAF